MKWKSLANAMSGRGDNILSGLDLGSGAHMLQMVPAACLLPRCQQHACYVGASSI